MVSSISTCNAKIWAICIISVLELTVNSALWNCTALYYINSADWTSWTFLLRNSRYIKVFLPRLLLVHLITKFFKKNQISFIEITKADTKSLSSFHNCDSVIKESKYKFPLLPYTWALISITKRCSRTICILNLRNKTLVKVVHYAYIEEEFKYSTICMHIRIRD